ncbi:MAG: hypothetical protein JJT96_12775 [Opitutales bacterium]|nr:hypothetical protein [Opitutales bacterium]
MTEYSIFLPQSLKTHVLNHLGAYQRAGTVLALCLFFGGSGHLWQQGLSPLPSMAVSLPGSKLAEDVQSRTRDGILERAFAQQGAPDFSRLIETFQKSGELSRYVEEDSLLEGTPIQMDYALNYPDRASYPLSKGDDGVDQRFYIDGETFTILKRSLDGSHQLELVYGQFRRFEDGLLPHEENLFNDGKLQSTLLLHGDRINGGKPVHVFESPESEKVETALAGR